MNEYTMRNEYNCYENVTWEEIKTQGVSDLSTPPWDIKKAIELHFDTYKEYKDDNTPSNIYLVL